jgi:hypothetical protein
MSIRWSASSPSLKVSVRALQSDANAEEIPRSSRVVHFTPPLDLHRAFLNSYLRHCHNFPISTLYRGLGVVAVAKPQSELIG